VALKTEKQTISASPGQKKMVTSGLGVRLKRAVQEEESPNTSAPIKIHTRNKVEKGPQRNARRMCRCGTKKKKNQLR